MKASQAKHLKTKEKPKGTVFTVLLIVFLILGVFAAANSFCTLKLWKYIDTLEPVDHADSFGTFPEEENGRYVFSTDRDFKIVYLTDIHLGGGLFTIKKDVKNVYEITGVLSSEEPDLVILGGDNVLADAKSVLRCGTLNSRMASKLLMHLLDHEGVFYSAVFGESESFGYQSREKLADVFEDDKSEYNIFCSEFSDTDNKAVSVSNQIICLKSTDGNVRKLLLLLDSNAYVDKRLRTISNGDLDVIHKAQTDWAASEIAKVINTDNEPESKPVIVFTHIPVGEYQTAYSELKNNDFEDTEDSRYMGGVWNNFSAGRSTPVSFGGSGSFSYSPNSADSLFESLGPDGLNVLDAVLCGHDHLNNAAAEYRSVRLLYGYSMDNISYKNIDKYGLQRGCVVITVHPDSICDIEYKNAYLDLGVEKDRFGEIYLDRFYNSDYEPK